MAKVSVIIPSRHELYLTQTVESLLEQAGGDVEIIVILDGYWPAEYPQDYPRNDKRVTLVHREKRGMRAAINAGISIARGEYIMKLDAHCALSPGYDLALQQNCDRDWIVIPRRYSLEADTWQPKLDRPYVDYEYLAWPWRAKRKGKTSEFGLHGWVWDERQAERIDRLVDETMTLQGSCWFMPREYFQRRIGQMDETGYGTFIGEAQELGLKTWLGGGKVMVNKQAWYAHLWKGEAYREKFLAFFGQHYTRLGISEFRAGNKYSVEYWFNNLWPERKHNLSWLIERFWPVPSWPEECNAWRTP